MTYRSDGLVPRAGLIRKQAGSGLIGNVFLPLVRDPQPSVSEQQHCSIESIVPVSDIYSINEAFADISGRQGRVNQFQDTETIHRHHA